MEWLFFATKQSFLSSLTFLQQIAVLAASPLIPSMLVLLALLGLALLGSLFHNAYRRFWKAIGKMPATLLLAFSGMLIVDNFTNTVLHFGIKSSHGITRLCYAFLFLVFCLGFYRLLSNWGRRLTSTIKPRMLFISIGVLLFISISAAVLSHTTTGRLYDSDSSKTVAATPRPNILLIGSDGVSAEHMSAYGYDRDTTPFIRKFAMNALVCKNAFPNAGNTGGSIVSILTGKLPTRTRIIYPPDVLRGVHAYQHLPGVLKKYGYGTIQLTIRNYADAYDVNMRLAFDSVNFRSLNEQGGAEMLSPFVGQDTAYFLQQTYDRVTERLEHIFGQRDMEDPFTIVTQAKRERYPDSKNLNELFSFIRSSKRPFFAHIHLLGTHGATFSPKVRKFSAGEEQNNKWMSDFYDDSVLEFDETFRNVVNFLRKTKKLKNTIIILYSDHGLQYTTNVRLPLLFWFPGNQYRGAVLENVQNLDIAPTILDHLDISKPQWMEGQSLLSRLDACRPIVSAASNDREHIKKDGFFESKGVAPFFTLGCVSVIVCNEYFKLNLVTRQIETGKIDNYIDHCETCSEPNQSDIIRFILNHLRETGYDTSSVENSKFSWLNK